MKTRPKLQSGAVALVGCTGIILYFILTSAFGTSDLLRLRVSRDEIVKRAKAELRQSEFTDYGLSQRISVDLNDDLMTYAQTHLDNALPEAFYPVASWQVEWSGEAESKKDEPEEIRYLLEYDFDGTLIRMEQEAPFVSRPPNLEEREALRKADRFINSVNIDTVGLRLSDKSINTAGQAIVYNFVFTRPSPVDSLLRESYEISISGEYVRSYEAQVVFDFDELLTPRSYKIAHSTSTVIAILVWLTISIVMLVRFFVKLRHDELEFKRGVWTGFACFVMFWLLVGFAAWPDPTSVLLGGGIAGAFTGLALLIIYPVSDSLAREIWPERLVLGDLLFRGFFRVRELGKALLDSLFMSGVTLVILACLFGLARALHFGHLEFDESMLRIFNGELAFGSAVLNNVISAIFIGLMLFAFWLTYLKGKIRKQSVLLWVFAGTINLAGLHLFHVAPTFLAFVLFLPLAYLCTRFALKYDFLAILLAIFTVHHFLELTFIKQLDSPLVSLPGLFSVFYVWLILGAGVFFSYVGRDAYEFEHYVPEYVGRIAERERFLKELEIARNVQTRFLPQSIPRFPHLDIACICRPAMEVGGDYFDFILNGNDALSVIIGDVSGKGVSAAFYMTMAKGILKTLTKSIHNPKQILSEMNSIFSDNVPRGVFISVIYGEFDVARKILKFARAGHNPLIVCKHGGQDAEFFIPKGLAIGLDSGHLFCKTIEEIEVPFEAGDVFVFYTDGISESINKSGDEFGEERLRRTVMKNANESAQAILDKINREVNRFSRNAIQHDDFTMVVVKITDS